jgi:CheY-like chemotaxis protein
MKTILILDDEPQTIGVFQTALGTVGYSAQVANSGKKAWEILKGTKIDAILLDMMMPDMSGNDFIKMLKQEDQFKEIPIIVLTNFGNEELVKEAIALGAKDYILKYEASPADFAEKIKALVGE